MDQQGHPIDLSRTATDGTFFPTQPQSDEFDEELTRDLLSSEPATQRVDMWSDWTPFQMQYSTPPLSQPGQFDFGPFAGWGEDPAADFMPALMPLQPYNEEPLQVSQNSDITPTAPFYFAEIERQALQSSDYQTWQLAPQTHGSSFYLPSLDAPPTPYQGAIGGLSAQGSFRTPTGQMVLPTRNLQSTLSVAPATDCVHPVIAPKPHGSEIAPVTSSQSQALIPSSDMYRKSSKLRGLNHSDKQRQKRQKAGVESHSGYYEFSLKSQAVVKKHNSRFNKKLDASEKMTRDKGACVLCRHQKKKCHWSPSDTTCASCVKMIEFGGTMVIGTSITACLTTFRDAVKNLQSSGDKHVFKEFARVTFVGLDLQLPWHHENAICKIACLLDAFSTPRLRRTIPASSMAITVRQFTSFTSFLAFAGKLGYTGFGQPLVELSFYNTAFLCRCLPRGSRIELLDFFMRQQRNLVLRLPTKTKIEQITKVSATDEVTILCVETQGILTMGRLAKVMFDRNDAIHKKAIMMVAQLELWIKEVTKITP